VPHHGVVEKITMKNTLRKSQIPLEITIGKLDMYEIGRIAGGVIYFILY